MVGATRQLGLLVACLSIMALCLGLSMVWLSIGRMDTAYELREMEKEKSAKQALLSKLKVERDNLASTYRLRQKAEEYGLAPARSGQIRRMNTAPKTTNPATQ